MIYPKSKQDRQSISNHYDELDLFYRKLWGDHLHHGLWKTGSETQEEAVKQLVEHAAAAAHITRGMKVCDIGCGYGATARQLAEKEINVTGVTISQVQYAYAIAKVSNHRVYYLLEDWLENGLPDEHFDAALSIESSEHMVNKNKFFNEAFRILRPGGRLAVCAWNAKENPSSWEENYLLEPICREGRLPGIGSAQEYMDWMSTAGFKNIRFEDLSDSVKKTWSICCWRFLKALFCNPSLSRYLFDSSMQERSFAKTIFRILAAYRMKVMRYGLFSGERPNLSK